MEKTFEQFKEWIIAAAKTQNACIDGINDANNANDWQSMLSVVKKYSDWLYKSGIINAENLLFVPDSELLEASIYVKKENIIQKEGTCYYYSSTSEHYDSSTSKHYDSSTSEHYDSSTSKHYDSSTSKHYGSSTYGDVYELKDTSIIHDNAIVRERSTDKIYMKKKANIIIEL